jgi:hypothetical protein
MCISNIKYCIKYILYIILVCWGQFYCCQNQVWGSVKDKDTHLPVMAASIIIQKKGDTLYQFHAQTDKKGYFLIKNIDPGNYGMIIQQNGYQKLMLDLKVKDTAIYLQDIYLSMWESDIKEVNIKLLNVKIKSDTIQYNASAFRKKHDEYAEDLLKHLPGLFKDADGNFSIKGKEVENVLVNGQKFFGDDKNKALQHIPASMISKIEIYDGQSDQSNLSGIQDGLKATTINIITIQKKSLFGDVQAGISLNRYHNISGSLSTLGNKLNFSIMGQDDNANLNGSGNHKFSTLGNAGRANKRYAGINISYSKSSRLKFNGSLQYNAGHTDLHQNDMGTIFLPEDKKQYSRLESILLRKNETVQLNYTLTGRIDTITTITINSNAQVHNNHSNVNTSSEILQNGLPDNLINNTVKGLQKGFSGYINTSINRQFRKVGRSASLSLYYNFTDSRQNDSTDVYSILENNYLWRNIQYENSNTSFSVSANYSEPIFNHGILLTRYTYSETKGVGTRITAPLNASLLDNQYQYSINKINVHQGSTKYTYKRETYELSGSINLQNNRIAVLDSHNIENSITVYPEITFICKPTMQRSYSFNYRGIITPPSNTFLQPIIDNSNPAFIRLGNPELDSSLTHSFDLLYSTVNSNSSPLMVSLNAIVDQNAISENFWIANNGFQISKPINVNGNYSISLNFSKNMFIKYFDIDFDINTNIAFRQAVNKINGIQNNNRISVIQQTIALSKSIGEDIELNLNLQPALTINNTTLNPSQKNYFSSKFILDSSWKNGIWKITANASYMYYGRFDQSNSIDTLTFNIFGERKISEKYPLYLNVALYNLFNEKETVSRIISQTILLDSNKNTQPFYIMLGARWNIIKSFN